DDPDGPPPESLLDATREFLLGVAHTIVTSHKPVARSMLIHPSRLTTKQSVFERWIRQVVNVWADTHEHRHEAPAGSLKTSFAEAWQRLSETFPDIASFEDCWNSLEVVFMNLDIRVMNSTHRQGTPTIEWDNTKAYI